MKAVKVTFVMKKCLMGIRTIGKLQVLKKIGISLMSTLVVVGAGYAASSEVIRWQQKLVAELSGYEAGSNLKSRDTLKLRKQTAEYLLLNFQKLNGSPQLHKYQFKNVNGIVDLLLTPYKGQNIYNILPATTESLDYVIIGAHYDSYTGAPGAGDNAVGIAVVLELFKRRHLAFYSN